MNTSLVRGDKVGCVEQARSLKCALELINSRCFAEGEQRRFLEEYGIECDERYMWE